MYGILTILFFAIIIRLTYHKAQSLSIVKRTAYYLGLLGLFLITPIVLWMTFYWSLSFNRDIELPEKFKEDRIYNFMSRVANEHGSALLVNSDGLIANREYAIPKPKDITRIGLMGCSFAAGYKLNYEETLGVQLENLAGANTEVINFAFFGSNTEMQVDHFFHKGKKYDPDMLIVRFEPFHICPTSEKYYDDISYSIINKAAFYWPREFKNRIIRLSYTVIREKFDKYFHAHPAKVIKKQITKPLEDLRRHTASHDIEVIMVMDVCDADYAPVCDAVMDFSKRAGWHILDLTRAESLDLNDRFMKIPNDGHPTAYANREIARVTYEYIKQLPSRESHAARLAPSHTRQ